MAEHQTIKRYNKIISILRRKPMSYEAVQNEMAESRGRYNKTTKCQILNPTRLRGTAIAKSQQLIAKKLSVYPCLFLEHLITMNNEQ